MAAHSSTPSLGSIFTAEQVRTANQAERERMIRILALAHETGASVELARQAIDEADRQAGQQ